MYCPRRVYGVDFSGAANAGKKIWIASGEINEDKLVIENCFRAADLPESRREREWCLAKLRDFIKGESEAVFGMDFPFGLPKPLIKEKSWEQFILSFPDRYLSPEDFRDACHKATGGLEIKRHTDIDNKTPFSSYNLRLYRQTFFGIRDILHPLVREKSVCVFPMQKAVSGKPWIIEVCPASTLKRENLDVSYKGKTEAKTAARRRILEGMERAGNILIPSIDLRSFVLKDREGDALDSVIAAFATFRALQNRFKLAGDDPAYLMEGHVYA